jgi:hypothetical protein
VDPLVRGKADLQVLVPQRHLAWEGRSKFYELSYWIWICSKVLKYDSGSEFYELSYWIQFFSSKVLKYPTGYEHRSTQRLSLPRYHDKIVIEKWTAHFSHRGPYIAGFQLY